MGHARAEVVLVDVEPVLPAQVFGGPPRSNWCGSGNGSTGGLVEVFAQRDDVSVKGEKELRVGKEILFGCLSALMLRTCRAKDLQLVCDDYDSRRDTVIVDDAHW